jgi:D-glycero-D-manno-heptose 1,7-bisphosphate phosphatase
MADAPLPPIAFLDRDGTIIEDTGYVRDPDAMTVLAGAARAIARLNVAGVPVVVVTNQSGIARGILTWDQYHRVAERLDTLLAGFGARIDATSVCPHAPEIDGPCECRKPATGGHRAAAARLGLSATGGWCVGDRLTDLEPATALGGRGTLVLTGDGLGHESAAREGGFAIAADLATAVAQVLG